jgi:arylsulfatase A-like enzyme
MADLKKNLSNPALALAGLTSLFSGCTKPPEPRPNIIFILTDDHRWDMMGCAGNPIIFTPNLDRLAADGIRFQNAYVTTPISAASRASILTGMYERKHTYTFTKPPVKPDLLQETYPYLLRKSGYHTGFIGKLGVNFEKGWVDSLFDDTWIHGYPYWKEVDGRRIHLTDLEGQYAARFLDSCKPDQPFCLSLSFWAPHAVDESKEQYFWPEWCDTLYQNVTMPVPRTATKEVFDSHPDFIRHSFSRTRWTWRFDDPVKYQEMVKGYYRMISSVDAVIGRIRQKLEERGLAKNTIIIFMGDNGYFLGDRQLADKWLMYEQSLKVPLIVCDPRSSEQYRGRVEESPGLNIDISPTILSFAGVPVPASVQGQSLVPLMSGQSVKPRDYLLFEHLWDFDSIAKSECIRSDTFKYIRYLKHPGFEEFYNLKTDPDEIHNLIKDPAMGGKAEEYRNRLDSIGQKAEGKGQKLVTGVKD